MAGNGYKIYTQVNFKLSGVDESVSRAKGRLSELAASMASTREKIAKLESTYGKTAGKRELNAGWAAEKDNYDKLKMNLKAMQEEQKTLNALVKDGTRAYNVLKSAITAQDGMTPKVAEQLRRDIPKVMKNINSLGEGAQEKIRQLAEVMRISEAEVRKFSAGVADAFKPFNAKKGETWGESKAYVDMFEKVGHQLARTSEEYDKMAQHAAASRENMAKIEGVIRHTADAENEYVESLKAQIREEQKLQKIQGTKNADSDQRILSRMREQQLQSELGQHYANMLDKDSRKNLSTDQLQEALKGTRQWMEETKRYEEGLKAEYEKYLTWKQDPNHNRLVSEKEYKDALEREQLMQKESTQLEMQLRDQRIADNQKVVDAWKSQQQELMAQGKITSVSQDKVVLEEDYKRAATALKADTDAKIANAEATEKMTYDLRVYQEQQKAGLDFGRDKQLSEWNASYMAQQSQREAAERVLNKDIEEGTALLNQRTKATNEWTGADQAAHAAAKAESEELKSSNAEIIRQVEQNRTAYSEQVGEVRRVAEEKRNAARQELDDAQAVLSANNKLADINERNRQKQANADTRSALLVEAEGLRAEYKALREEKAAANAAESAALGQIKSKQDEIVNKERELVELKKQASDTPTNTASNFNYLAELEEQKKRLLTNKNAVNGAIPEEYKAFFDEMQKLPSQLEKAYRDAGAAPKEFKDRLEDLKSNTTQIIDGIKKAIGSGMFDGVDENGEPKIKRLMSQLFVLKQQSEESVTGIKSSFEGLKDNFRGFDGVIEGLINKLLKPLGIVKDRYKEGLGIDYEKYSKSMLKAVEYQIEKEKQLTPPIENFDEKIQSTTNDIKRMKDALREGFSDSAKTALTELDQLGEKVAQSKGMKFNVDSEDFKNKLTNAIQEAERVLADPKATQEMKDNIVRSINQAVTEAKGFTGLHALDIAGKDEAAQNALGRITTSLEKVTTATQTAQGELKKMGGALPQELIDKEQQLAEKTADYSARAKELHANERAVIEIENKIATAKENRLAAVRKVREIEEQLNKDLTNMSDAQIEKQNRLMEQYDRQKQKIEDLDKTIAQLDEKRNARTMTEEGSLEQLGKQKTRRGGSITFSEIEKIGQPALKAIDELWKQIAKDLKEVNDRTAEQNAKLEQAKIIRKAIKAEEARRASTNNRTVTDLEKEFAVTNKDYNVATGKLLTEKKRRFEQEMQDLNKILRNTAGYSEDELKRAIELSQKIVNTKSLEVTKEEKLKEAMFLGNEELRKRAQLTTKENMETQLGKDNKFLQRMSDDSLQKQLNYWREMEKAERDNATAVENYGNKVKAISAQIDRNAQKDLSNMLTASIGEKTQYKAGTLTSEDLVGLNATQLKEMQTNIQNLLNTTPTGNTNAIKEYNSDLKVLKDQLDILKTGEGARQFDVVWGETLKVLSGETHMTVDDIKKLEKELDTLKGQTKTNEKLSVGIKTEDKDVNKVKEIGKAIGQLKGMYGEASQSTKKYGDLTDTTYDKIKHAATAGASTLRRTFNEEEISIEDMRQALKRMRDEMNDSKDATVNGMAQMGAAARNLDKQVKELTDTEKNHVGTLENAADRLKNYVLVYVGFQQAVDYVTDKLKKNFELSDEMADIQKVTGLAREQVSALSNEVEELNSRTTHSDLMKLAYQGGKMGIGSDAPNAEYQTQQLGSFVNTANQLNMALGEDFGGAQAIASLAKLTKVMKVQATENVTMNEALEKTGSAILMLGNNSIASYNKISQFATRMGGIASSAHMAMPELLALGSTLDTFGAQSEMAATAMTKMISTLVKNPEKVARAVKAPVEEMQNLVWNGHITEGLELMFHSLKNNGAELEDIANNLKDIVGGGNNTRAMQVLAEMANGADTFTQHLEMSREAFEENTLVAEEYYIKNNTAMAYMDRLQNTINEQFANSSAVEWFTGVAKGMNDLVGRIEHFVPWVLARIAGIYISVKAWNAGMLASWNMTFGFLGGLAKKGYGKIFGETKKSTQKQQQAAKTMEGRWTLTWRLIAQKAKLAHVEMGGASKKTATQIREDISKTTRTLEVNYSTFTGLLRGAKTAVFGLGKALKGLASSMIWMAAMQLAMEGIYQLYDLIFKGKSEREAEKLKKFTEGLNENVNSVLTNIDNEMRELSDKYEKAAKGTDELTKATKKNTEVSKENAEAKKEESVANSEAAKANENAAKASVDASKASADAAKASVEASKAEAEAKAQVADASAEAAKASVESAKAVTNAVNTQAEASKKATEEQIKNRMNLEKAIAQTNNGILWAGDWKNVATNMITPKGTLDLLNQVKGERIRDNNGIRDGKIWNDNGPIGINMSYARGNIYSTKKYIDTAKENQKEIADKIEEMADAISRRQDMVREAAQDYKKAEEAYNNAEDGFWKSFYLRRRRDTEKNDLKVQEEYLEGSVYKIRELIKEYQDATVVTGQYINGYERLKKYQKDTTGKVDESTSTWIKFTEWFAKVTGISNALAATTSSFVKQYAGMTEQEAKKHADAVELMKQKEKELQEASKVSADAAALLDKRRKAVYAAPVGSDKMHDALVMEARAAEAAATAQAKLNKVRKEYNAAKWNAEEPERKRKAAEEAAAKASAQATAEEYKRMQAEKKRKADEEAAAKRKAEAEKKRAEAEARAEAKEKERIANVERQNKMIDDWNKQIDSRDWMPGGSPKQTPKPTRPDVMGVDNNMQLAEFNAELNKALDEENKAFAEAQKVRLAIQKQVADKQLEAQKAEKKAADFRKNHAEEEKKILADLDAARKVAATAHANAEELKAKATEANAEAQRKALILQEKVETERAAKSALFMQQTKVNLRLATETTEEYTKRTTEALKPFVDAVNKAAEARERASLISTDANNVYKSANTKYQSAKGQADKADANVNSRQKALNTLNNNQNALDNAAETARKKAAAAEIKLAEQVAKEEGIFAKSNAILKEKLYGESVRRAKQAYAAEVKAAEEAAKRKAEAERKRAEAEKKAAEAEKKRAEEAKRKAEEEAKAKAAAEAKAKAEAARVEAEKKRAEAEAAKADSIAKAKVAEEAHTDSINKSKAATDAHVDSTKVQTDSTKEGTVATNDDTSSKDGNSDATAKNSDANDKNAKAQDKATKSTEEKTKAQKANKEVIDTINSAYGQYIGYILKETSANYELANSLAVVAARRREDALAQAKAQVESKANEKFSDLSGEAVQKIKAGLQEQGISGTKAQKYTQDIVKWMKDYIKNNNVDENAFDMGSTGGKALAKYIGETVKEAKGTTRTTSDKAKQIVKSISGGTKDYVTTEKDRLDYIEGMNIDIESRLEEEHKSVVKAVKTYGLQLKNGIKAGELNAKGEIAKEDEKGIFQLEEEIKAARKKGVDSQKLREMQIELNEKRANYIKFVEANIDSFTEAEKKERRKDIDRFEKANTAARRTEGWDDFMDIEMKDPTEVRKAWLHLKTAWMGTGKGDGINPIQKDTWQKFGASVGQEFKSFEDAKAWQEDMRKKLEDQNSKFLDATPLAEWDTKKDKSGRSKKGADWNQAESQAMIAELDRYYETRKTVIEKWLAEEKITKEQYDKMIDDNESEHLAKRRLLRSTFTKQIYDEQTEKMRGMTADEVKNFTEWWALMNKQGKLEKAKWTVVWNEWVKLPKMTHEQLKNLDKSIKDNNFNAQKDLTAYEKIVSKHVEAVRKIFEEDNPFLKLFSETQKDMAELGVLVTSGEIENIEQGKDIMLQRINFLMTWVQDAYKKGSAELIADIKANPELSPWAAMLEENPQDAEALMIRVRNMYSSINEAIKKEATRMKRDAEVLLEVENGDGKSMREQWEEQTRSIERAQHAVEQYNSAVNGGYLAGRNADAWALKAIKSKIAVQKQELALMKQIAEQRIRETIATAEELKKQGDANKANAEFIRAEQMKKALDYATKEYDKTIRDLGDNLEDKFADINNKMIQYIKGWSDWLKDGMVAAMAKFGTEMNDKYDKLATNRYYGTGDTGSVVTIIDNAGRNPDKKDGATVREEYMTENEQLLWEIEEENRQKQAEAWRSILDSFSEKMNDTLNDIIADGIDDMNMREQMAAQAANTSATVENTRALGIVSQTLANGINIRTTSSPTPASTPATPVVSAAPTVNAAAESKQPVVTTKIDASDKSVLDGLYEELGKKNSLLQQLSDELNTIGQNTPMYEGDFELADKYADLYFNDLDKARKAKDQNRHDLDIKLIRAYEEAPFMVNLDDEQKIYVMDLVEKLDKVKGDIRFLNYNIDKENEKANKGDTKTVNSDGSISVNLEGIDFSEKIASAIVPKVANPSLASMQAKMSKVNADINGMSSGDANYLSMVTSESERQQLDLLLQNGDQESYDAYWAEVSSRYNDKIAELRQLKETIQTMITETYGENPADAINGMSEDQIGAEADKFDSFMSIQESMRTAISKTQSMNLEGQLQTDKKMSNSSKKTFNSMIQCANLFGAAYQTVADNNLSTEQKLAQFGLQAMGQAATAGLTALLAQTTAEGAANEAGAIGKAFSQMGPVGGAAAVAAITALLGAALGLAASKITKSKSQIASVTGASSGKLATGMLTYANGRLPLYADGTEDNGQRVISRGTQPNGARYTVTGNDGRDYSAAFEDRLKTKLYKGGAHFGIFSEKKPEIVIGGNDTARILSEYPFLYEGILAVHRGQDPRLAMDFGYIQHQIENLSKAEKLSIAKSAFGKMPAYAEGNLPELGIRSEELGIGTEASGMNGGMDMAQTMMLMNQFLSTLINEGVSAGVEIGGKHGLDRQQKKYERWKKRNGIK